MVLGALGVSWLLWSGSTKDPEVSSPSGGAEGAELLSVPSASQVELGEKVLRPVSIMLNPVPEQGGGNLFLSGFAEVDESSGVPREGAFPAHSLPVALWVSEFPWTGEVEVIPSLYYFARYGYGALPEPSNRTSQSKRVPEVADGTLEFIVRAPPGLAGPVTGRTDSDPSSLEKGSGLNLVRSPLGQVILDVAFVVELAPTVANEVGTHRLVVAGFEASAKSPLPAAEQPPAFLWFGEPSEAPFPREVVVPIPKGLAVLIFAAKGDDFDFSESALRGAFLPPMVSVAGSVRYVLGEVNAVGKGLDSGTSIPGSGSIPAGPI